MIKHISNKLMTEKRCWTIWVIPTIEIQIYHKGDAEQDDTQDKVYIANNGFNN